jgi:16S rRNA (uracil1498-N3)-methyltransferase
MRRFFIDPKDLNRDNFHITDLKICNHIRTVLRMQPGDKIILFDGKGNEFTGELTRIQKNHVGGKITETRKDEKISDLPQLILAQSLPRAGKLDEIIRMNTEVGVSAFIIFESEYSVAKAESVTDQKLERLERLAIEASRQSERAAVPKISGPLSFQELLQTEADLKLLLHSKENTAAVAMDEIRKQLKPGLSVLMAIGPEGGFSEKEVKAALDSGFKLVHLKLPVLRTETAGIAISSIILY